MRRPATAAAVGVLAVVVAVTGCGSVRSTGADGTPAAGGAAASSAALPDPAEQVRKGVAEHDRLFPQVAALGCASARPSTPAGGPGATSAVPAEPVDPWVAKHAENSMYKQMALLGAEDRCRGEAHSRRISEAVKARTATAPPTQDAVRGILESLGYPRTAVQISAYGSEVSFELTVPGAGPCVAGRIGASVTVEAHGYYLEGGCTEPKGGH
ncbi:hypothetical protein ACFVVL_12140 [Kitasatospora sp. NPDC058115]|uniref:hypothetical protein n=1 Tax=Kitasatospora sp. NPDC058115 TaxID=3346347 RepID=UPI0036DEC70C